MLGYRTPASRRAFWRIVSLTAAKTRRMLLVSVACVKLLLVTLEDERTVGRPSYLIVASFVRIGTVCTLPLFRDPYRLMSTDILNGIPS